MSLDLKSKGLLDIPTTAAVFSGTADHSDVAFRGHDGIVNLDKQEVRCHLTPRPNSPWHTDPTEGWLRGSHGYRTQRSIREANSRHR